MTAPAKRPQTSTRTLEKASPMESAKLHAASRLAAKLDRLVFAAPPPQGFGLD